jgi:hypothetical protein
MTRGWYISVLALPPSESLRPAASVESERQLSVSWVSVECQSSESAHTQAAAAAAAAAAQQQLRLRQAGGSGPHEQRELVVAVWDEVGARRQSRDDIAQRRQALVDRLRLTQALRRLRKKPLSSPYACRATQTDRQVDHQAAAAPTSADCTEAVTLNGHRCGMIRVRVEIMGPGKYENVGKSQSVLYDEQSHYLHPHP